MEHIFIIIVYACSICFIPNTISGQTLQGVVHSLHILPFQFTNECNRNVDINSGSKWETQMQKQQRNGGNKTTPSAGQRP